MVGNFIGTSKSTGTTSDQWQSLAYTRTPFVKTGTYDVVNPSNWGVWQTSQSAKFIVTNAKPNQPTITQSKTGDVTVTPGAVRNILISGQMIISKHLQIRLLLIKMEIN